MERVLVVGATGNIGISAVIGALRAKREVLAIVRNQASASKLFEQVGSKEGITTVEADVTSEQGVQGVLDRVKAGELPDFQHVYATGTYDARSTRDMKIFTDECAMKSGAGTRRRHCTHSMPRVTTRR